MQYVRHLEKSSPPVQAAKTDGTVEHFAQGYQDYLQNPLQVDPISPFQGQILISVATPAAYGQLAINYVPNL